MIKLSSRKSIESANNDTEWILNAKKNSTKKYEKLIIATNKIFFLKLSFCIINFNNIIEKKKIVINSYLMRFILFLTLFFSFNTLNATSFVDSVRKSFGKESGCYNNSMKDGIKSNYSPSAKKSQKNKK